METELKLLIDATQDNALRDHPVLARTPSTQTRLVTTYFDTPELSLRASGASLRIRKADGGFVQTVKLADPAGGLAARGEWEWPIRSAKLSTTGLDSLPDDAQVVGRQVDRVARLFTTEIDRTTWALTLDGGTRIEAALDRGVARAGRKKVDIHEIELELKAGPRAPLFRLAIDLADRYGLRYGPLSKAERGYGLITDRPGPKRGTAVTGLDDAATLDEVFPRLLDAALGDLAADIPTASRRDVEGVHRMRAAIRKLRTLLVLFAPDLDRAAVARFNASLRDLGTVLGRGRDWDVFLTETLPRARDETGAAVLDLLVAPAEAQRATAHAEIAAVLQGQAPTRLMLGLAAWTADGGWHLGKHRDRPLTDVVRRRLARLARKVEKRAKHLDGAETEPLHDLRKSLKKLRYGADMVGPLFGEDKVGHFLHAIKTVLSVLGEVNDASVTVARLDDVAPAARPELAPAAALLLGWNETRRAKAFRRLGGKLRKFERQPSFWA